MGVLCEIKLYGKNYVMRNFIICSPRQNVIRLSASRRMGLAEYVAYMGEMRYAHKIVVGKPKGRRPLRTTLGGGTKILLKLILKKQRVRLWTGLIWFGIRTSGGLL
jgi:hypothetical protein